MPNCSAITIGEWFGNMMPPAPTRMDIVPPATWPMHTAVAALAMPARLWCSASQKRVKPAASTCWARSRALASASAGVKPSPDIGKVENGKIYHGAIVAQLCHAAIRVDPNRAREHQAAINNAKANAAAQNELVAAQRRLVKQLRTGQALHLDRRSLQVVPPMLRAAPCRSLRAESELWIRRSGYRLISQFGNASLSLATPASVIWVSSRLRVDRLLSASGCTSPAPVIWVFSRPSHCRLLSPLR